MRYAAAFCGTRPGGWVGWVAIHSEMTFDITQTDGISFQSATCFCENLHRNEGCKCMSSLILEDELDIVTCLTVWLDHKDVYTHHPGRPWISILHLFVGPDPLTSKMQVIQEHVTLLQDAQHQSLGQVKHLEGWALAAMEGGEGFWVKTIFLEWIAMTECFFDCFPLQFVHNSYCNWLVSSYFVWYLSQWCLRRDFHSTVWKNVACMDGMLQEVFQHSFEWFWTSDCSRYFVYSVLFVDICWS